MSDTTTATAVETNTGGGSAILSALSEPDRQKWQMTGELPKAEPATPAAVADPEDDDESEPAASATEKPDKTAAAAAPAADKPISKRQLYINDLERKAKAAELRASEVEKRLSEIEARTVRQPATEPKAEPKAEPVVDPNDPEPDIQKYEDYQKYLADFTRWQIRQDKREAKAEADKAEAKKRADDEHRTKAERVSGWVKRRDTFVAANPTKADALLEFLGGVFPDTPIGDTIMDSPVGAAVAVYLKEHPDVLERIQSAHPIVALRELGKLEAKLETPDSEVTRASASAGPAAKTVTTAPVPPTTLSARSADPADPLDAALKDRDFRRYEAEANARDFARK